MHRDSQKKFERKTQCKIFQGGSVKKGFPHILAPKSGAEEISPCKNSEFGRLSFFIEFFVFPILFTPFRTTR